MARSLEARVPILDQVVAELALAFPSHESVRGLKKKRLLRCAVAPLLPQIPCREGFFRPGAVAHLTCGHLAGLADQSRKIWARLAFSLWFNRYVSGSLPS
jgi:hypothetical protein